MKRNLSELPREVKHLWFYRRGPGLTSSVCGDVANKSSDFSAMTVKFPLLQILSLQRCAGAKVGGDLLAPKPINILSHSQGSGDSECPHN
jgi:hypothetical protein